MTNIRKTFHLREVTIAFVITIAALLSGLFLDWSVTNQLFNPTNVSWYGIIFSGIGELPVIIALYVSGAGLIIARRRKPIWLQVIMFICAIGAFLFALYYCYDTFTDLAKFKQTEDYSTLIKILGVLFSLFMGAAVLLPMFLLSKKFDKEILLKVSIILFFSIVTVVLCGQFLKYFVGRERPFSAYHNEDSYSHYDSLWSIHPFRALCLKFHIGPYSFNEGDKTDYFKSFPSGHSMYAAFGMLLYPLLTLLNPKTKECRPLQISMFYLGLVWTLIVTSSRIVAGYHYLTDVSSGTLLTLTVSLIAIIVISKIIKDKKLLTD